MCVFCFVNNRCDDKDMGFFGGLQRGKSLAGNFLMRQKYLPPLNSVGEMIVVRAV